MSLNLSLIIRAVDQVTGPVSRMRQSIGRLAAAGGLPQVTEATRGVTRATGNLGRELTKMTAIAGGAAYAFKRLFVDGAAEFERYQVMLNSLEGSQEKAQAAFDWVSAFAARTPLELDGAMDAFVRLRTFGLDPMDGTMQALVDQTAKMGGSQETLNGIVLAVGQAWTKQKLQGEEALQLIERGVPVWDLLAKRSGKTAAELQKLSSEGRLGRSAIKALIEEMGKASAGAADAQAKTWAGLISNLSDQWTRFSQKVMKNGVFDWLKGRLQGVLEYLNRLADSGRMDEIARQFGDRLVAAFEGLWSALQSIVGALRWAHDLFGSWQPLLIGLAAVLAGPLLLALMQATWAVGALGVALLSTPVGWILAAVAAVAGAVYLIYKNWGAIAEWFGGLWEGIKAVFNTGVEWITRVLEKTPLGLALRGLNALGSWMGTTLAEASRPTAATLAGGAGRAEVGGTIRVVVEGDGRPRVRSVESSGGVGMDVETGMMMGGAY